MSLLGRGRQVHNKVPLPLSRSLYLPSSSARGLFTWGLFPGPVCQVSSSIAPSSSTTSSPTFLDAPSHLYMRSCPSVRRSVRPSVGPALFSKVKSTHTRRILCRVFGLVMWTSWRSSQFQYHLHHLRLWKIHHRSRFLMGQGWLLENCLVNPKGMMNSRVALAMSKYPLARRSLHAPITRSNWSCIERSVFLFPVLFLFLLFFRGWTLCNHLVPSVISYLPNGLEV